MAVKNKVEELIGQDLAGFKIVLMTEVYGIDSDGRKSTSLGFFKDVNVATAFAGMQTDANWHRTAHALILTNGVIGYVIENREPVKLFDDEAETIEIKRRALAKLSPAERALFKLGS